MNFRAECFELGFICESRIESENRGEVLEQVLVHLNEVHATGAGSTGFKDFVSRHISQVDDEPEPTTPAAEAGARRRSRGSDGVKNWIADRLRRPGSQPNPDEEPAT